MKAKLKNFSSNPLELRSTVIVPLRGRFNKWTLALSVVLLSVLVPIAAVRAQNGAIVPNAAMTNTATTTSSVTTPSAAPATPAAVDANPTVPSPPAAPAPVATVPLVTPSPSATAPTAAKAPAISAPVAAFPAASDAQPPAGKPIRVGKLSPEELKARQVAEDRARAAQARGPAAANSADTDRAEPSNPLDYLKDNEWQRHAEIRSGNVTVLRRSTDEPPAPNETVILRWRTPSEFSRSAFMSSKGHTPNQLGK